MVINRQRYVRVPTARLGDFVGRVKAALRLGNCELTVCLVSDAEIARLNKRYRGKRGPTDVLSFPVNGSRERRKAGRRRRAQAAPSFTSSNSFPSFTSYLGDVAISPQTARRNARRQGRPLGAELRILVLHGVLHLLGYDHETDHGQMERRERRLRRQLGLR